jgi:hypothetical protein
MATRKPQSSRSKPAQASKPSKPQTPQKQPTRLENLAARKHASGSFDDLTLDDQLVDNSGVFRVTSAIAQAQTGHDEDSSMRFPNDSLVMQAQRGGVVDEGPTIDEAVGDESAIEDEATRAERKARLATLAARARHQQQIRRR